MTTRDVLIAASSYVRTHNMGIDPVPLDPSLMLDLMNAVVDMSGSVLTSGRVSEDWEWK